ncbi:helix-hairpin-helix domain-containing protein [Planococcus salinus]|uniref:helix-hairpin-helix domain-containing protein n=1 Tax=Planococcus salinus TaxID=1848460 RepID=UPI001EFFD172|nr:helix-hairpin-helix domain-containing protein [Planococcus salinus]
MSSFDLNEAESPQQTETPPTVEPIQISPVVDVKGAVAHPGVYELSPEARIQDLIQAAGGFLPEADSRAINLAMKLQDEMSVYVPAVGEEILLPESPHSAAATGDTMVNLNTAAEAELTSLPGIGPSKAAAIITYRTDHGNFKTIDELKEVTGIGDKTFEQLKDAITVK